VEYLVQILWTSQSITKVSKGYRESKQVAVEQFLGIVSESSTHDNDKRRNFVVVVEDKLMVKVYHIDIHDTKDTILVRAFILLLQL
jgi:hypothetical protein